MEDPNLHLSVVLEVCDTLKINRASTNAIRLCLFPFSLRDKARVWLHSLPLESITTWEELTKAFLAKFFPLSKTASLHNQITSSTQRKDETLYEAWKRFKDLLRLCPHHGLQKWMVVQTFYNRVTQPVRSMIDAAARGTLMSKTEEEAYNLIEEMALNNYQWSNEQGQPKRVGGKYEIFSLTLLTAKMDAMTQKLDKLNVHIVNSCTPSPLCDRCGTVEHVTKNCQVGNPFAPPHVEHVAYVSNFQPRPNHDPYSNSYNPGWKQHPNFSYRTDPLPFSQANARPAPGF